MGHWLVDTPGVAALLVAAIWLSVLAAYTRMVLWIRRAPSEHPATPAGPAGEEHQA